MHIGAGHVLVIAGIALMFGLSQPRELRPGRWVKMLFSLPVLGFLGLMLGFQPAHAGEVFGNVFAYVAATMVFTLIWLRNFTWFSAEAFHRLTFGSGKAGGSKYPDYRGARSRVEDGEFEQAIEFVQFELKKEPGNFEGLWLLAAIYQELKRPREALEQLDKILNCPTSTPEQIAAARAAQTPLRALEIQQENERARR